MIFIKCNKITPVFAWETLIHNPQGYIFVDNWDQCECSK